MLQKFVFFLFFSLSSGQGRVRVPLYRISNQDYIWKNLNKVSLSDMIGDVLGMDNPLVSNFDGIWDDSQLDELEKVEHQHDANFYNGDVINLIQSVNFNYLFLELKDMFKKEHLDQFGTHRK